MEVSLARASTYACSSVLFVADGSGATFVVPLLVDLVQKAKAKAGESLCKRIHLVWAAKHRREFI